MSMPSSNRNTRGSWCSRGRVGRGHGSKHTVYEAETTDTSKPIVDATNSEVNVVKLLQAYGMVPTEGSELKHRRKKVTTEEMSIFQTLGDDFTFLPKPLVLCGSPVVFKLRYSGNCLMKILCQLIHTLPPILFQWR